MRHFNHQRLHSLLNSWVGAPAIHACFQALHAAYVQPNRHYHAAWHIDECLGLSDEYHSLVQNPGQLELSIWFHDFVYEPGARDNESASAARAAEWLESLGASTSTIEAVRAMILATARHEVPEGGPTDCSLMIDIDLASLAAPPEVFAQNTELIRREFHQIDEQEFARGRERFIKDFLAREHIYQTEAFRTRFEANARANLRRSLAGYRAALTS